MTIANKIRAIIFNKCPRCHEGDLYETSIWSFKRLFAMKENCPNCGQKYVLEPGFYWGAMYISYMLSSGLMLATFALLYFVFDVAVFWTFVWITVVTLSLYAVIYRLARSVWIHINVRYGK